MCGTKTLVDVAGMHRDDKDAEGTAPVMLSTEGG